MGDPEATVVIPSRNRPRFLDEAVGSALEQTFSDVEVVVIDDGSDPPARVADDPRVRLLRVARSQGASAARNRGLATARGQWITFLDDDDRLEPDMLERSLTAIERSPLTPPVAAWSALALVNVSGSALSTRVPVDLPRGSHRFLRGSPPGRSYLPVNSLVVETALLRDIGGWDEDVVVWEHADLLLRLDPVCSVQARESIGYRMTEHHGPRNRGSDLRRARGIAGTMTKHRALFMEHARPQYAGSMRRASHHYLLAERWADAVRCAGRALMAEPTSARSYRSLMASLAGGRVARARAHRRAVQPRGADVTA